MKRWYWFSLPIILLAWAFSVYANNLSVGTPALTGQNSTSDYTFVQFDLSWDNSWQDEENWDAAWVFLKYKVTGGDWEHAYLNTSAGNHTIPTGFTCTVGETGSNGMGVFIYRSGSSSGNNNLANVQLRWEYGDNNVADDATVTVKVFAVEMVFVPTDAFYIGDTDKDQNNCFYKYGTSGPYQITGEGAISIGESSDNLWANSSGFIETSTLPANFPKGYNAFYCMKYEISQGQYADFLNTITASQATARYPNQNGNNRHTISGSHPNYSASAADRGCNFLSWADGTAYLDWAGLRPMTELEFEKTCRGDQNAVDDEHAWGNANISGTAYSISNDGTASATVSNAVSDPTGNASYGTTDGDLNGPLRCGIFATGSSTRAEAGASYYGIMELSGNLFERAVTLANANGRAYTGAHGNGSLATGGDADVTNWPDTGASGAGFRGGALATDAAQLTVSDRNFAGTILTNRDYGFGFRGVRTAP